MEKYDFGGWATRNNLRCSDGRVIVQDAFKDNDGQTVPLVWNHQHNDPLNVLGHAKLENRKEGVYAYCSLNDTESGRSAKLLVEHGDVSALSIYANKLKQQGSNVLHGAIREVSLVLAGANPGAYIDSIIKHGEESEEEAYIYTGEDIQLAHSEDVSAYEDEIVHADKEKKGGSMADNTSSNDKKTDAEDKTVQDVIDSMTEEQKTVLYALVGQALEDNEGDEENDEETEGGNNTMKHNVFDSETETAENVISHSDIQAAIGDLKRAGSMRDAFIAHGIDNIDYLFPDAKTVTPTPEFIKRDMGWISVVMGGIHHTPFSRIKSVFADITEDEARAKGYIKGKLKKEEVFGLLKRTTTPTTVYKKQKFDRDDIIDITDFDVIAWIKGEMRTMLDEELARAFLFGDGRLASSDDKINEQNIRPVWTDNDLFTVKAAFEVDSAGTSDDKARNFIRTAIKSRKEYKGSGNPILFITEDMLTDCLLMEDKMGRVVYDTEEKLRTALRVSRIVSVEVMEGLTRSGAGDLSGKTLTLEGLYLNLNDYNVGADKGGAVNMFDDFDIDYNLQKYLIETRCSGALIKPFSAVAIESYPKA